MTQETITLTLDKAESYVVTLPVDCIQVGKRCRQDLGDIPDLAASIKELGLLQPIGVDRSYNLIFGARRLEAHKALGLDNIKVRILAIADPLLAEEHENAVRKDFTPSERVAIAAALKEAIGTRQGRRTDRVQGELVENIPQVETGQKTRQVIAKQAGFGNETTLRQATTVVEQGIPALVEAMDKGVIAIATAAKLARAPAATQHQAVDQPQAAPALAKQAGALRKPAIIDNDSGAVFDTQRAARADIPAPLVQGSVVYGKSHAQKAAHIARVARDLRLKVNTSSRTPLAIALEDLRDIRDSAVRLIASLEKLAKQGGAS